MANPNKRSLNLNKLLQVASLRDAFQLFGVAEGDRIDTRELVIMTSTIEEEMRTAKADLMEIRDFEAAAQLRDRLAQLRSEFLRIQTEEKSVWQGKEAANFERARSKLGTRARRDAHEEQNNLFKVYSKRRSDMQLAHRLQRRNLEAFIANMHRPRVRYSKQLLDMMHSENHLARLDQFEDARALSKHIALQRPKEEERHVRGSQHREQLLRRNLVARQEFEWAKLGEKLHEMQLRHDRSVERTQSLSTLRLRHHEGDMANRHTTSSPIKFCAVRGGKVRPVVRKRKNYTHTDASFRGTQLLESVQGDAIKDVISLCTIHNFDNSDEPEYHAPN